MGDVNPGLSATCQARNNDVKNQNCPTTLRKICKFNMIGRTKVTVC